MSTLSQWFSNFYVCTNHLGVVGLGWVRICISKKHLGGGNAAGPHFEKQDFRLKIIELILLMILFITFIERYYLQDTSQLGPEDVAVNKKETTPALKDHKI